MAFDKAWLEKLAITINAMGYVFIGHEQAGSLVRLYIDKPHGVTIDDCAKVSAQVHAMMVVEGMQHRGYRLEVSSPGIDRPLFTIAHYEQYLGSQVKIKLYTPLTVLNPSQSSTVQQRQLKGMIKQVVGETIYIEVDDRQDLIDIPFSNIEKGHLIGDLNRK